MKLYYLVGACSLASHIALCETGLPFEPVAVGRDRKTADGRDFTTINPYGYVPALELDDGRVLLEGPAILQFIADLKPEAGLAPPAGTFERYQLQSLLTFINSEVHKLIGAMFKPDFRAEDKPAQLEKIRLRLGQFSAQFGDREWLLGERFGVADAYLFVVLGWLPKFGVPLSEWPNLAAHNARVAARPAVRAALKAEGLA
ncbi:glutathione binding-like protein [Arenimonas caeni]|jgi:glutathione S-transferase|uniref:glutathione binding-like protein n=1 Tax=Arenimonas caeni TaxID=2058085 RepID=UPI002A35BB33|nr:glutathione binding-like protein [Arenimonas caeni]MDY0022785.1 glutathione binding-like protein [Arenimonas caeni]